MAKAKSRSKHWEREAKAGVEKINRMKKETMEAKQEAKVAHLAATSTGDAKVRVEEDLARVLNALAPAEEDMCRSKAENSRLAVEQSSLLPELEASKDEVSSLHSQASKDKEAIEKDYQKALESIFAYGYRCCVFKHSICGDQPKIPAGMSNSTDPLPPEFFVNPRCPPPPPPPIVEVKVAEIDLGKAAKDPEESCRGTRLTSFPMLVLVILGDFCKGRRFDFIFHFNEI